MDKIITRSWAVETQLVKAYIVGATLKQSMQYFNYD